MKWDWKWIRLEEVAATAEMMAATGEGWEVVSHSVFTDIQPNPKRVLAQGEAPIVAVRTMSVVMRRPAPDGSPR